MMKTRLFMYGNDRSMLYYVCCLVILRNIMSKVRLDYEVTNDADVVRCCWHKTPTTSEKIYKKSKNGG